MAVCYAQVFQKLIDQQNSSIEISCETYDDVEETADNSSEENSFESDQDEDCFGPNEILQLKGKLSASGLNSDSYTLDRFGHYPEIDSPPPQG